MTFALSEWSAGSDVKALNTIYYENNDNYILEGSKFFVSSINEADYMITLAKSENQKISCFLIPKNSKNLIIGKEY